MFTMLNLLIYEHVDLSIYSDLRFHLSTFWKFSVYKSYTCFIRFITKHFFFSNYKQYCVVHFGFHPFIARIQKYCILQLCWTHLLILVLRKFLGIFIGDLMSLANHFYFFLFNLYVFNYFLFLPIVVVRTSRTMLNTSGGSGHPCLISNIKGKTFSLSPLSMMLAVGFW